MRWFELFFLLIVGILFFCLGWEIWKKEKISLIHDYHHKKVKDSDKKAYTKKPKTTKTIIWYTVKKVISWLCVSAKIYFTVDNINKNAAKTKYMLQFFI